MSSPNYCHNFFLIHRSESREEHVLQLFQELNKKKSDFDSFIMVVKLDKVPFEDALNMTGE